MDSMRVIVERNQEIFEIPFYPYFENKHGQGSWRRFCELMARDCNRFTAIARKFELSSERVRQLFDKRIAPYIDIETGHERKKACALTRLQVKSFPDYVVAAWRMARRHDLTVSAVNVSKLLWLNGSLCLIHMGNGLRPSSLSLNGLVGFHGVEQSTFPFHIYVIRFADRSWMKWTYYVIEIEKLLNLRAIYLPSLPEAERVYARFAPWARKYDWSLNLNGWHLIPPPAQQSKPDP